MSTNRRTALPPNVAKIHGVLGRELTIIYTKWNWFKTLYCTSEETIQLLDYAASFFFSIFKEILRDDIITSLCRITDPKESMGKQNLTIGQLVSLIPVTDNVLKLRLERLLPALQRRTASFRVHRNRRVSHADLNTRLTQAARNRQEEVLLPGLEIADTNRALAGIAIVLDLVEHYFGGKTTPPYDEGINGAGNENELINFIRDEKNLRKYFNNKEFGDPP